MISVKNKKEIEIIAQAGEKLAWVKRVVAAYIKPGMTLVELDRIADGEIRRVGAEAAFKRVPGYKWATCINVNEGLVHGIPGDRKIKSGDKISVDVGVYFQGWNLDSAWTCGVSPISPELKHFIDVGKKALKAGIEQARVGNRVGHISQAIENSVKEAGYSPSQMFAGHGIGKVLHEEPMIPCYLLGRIEDTPALAVGMTLAIEAIYTEGNSDVVIAQDGWTAATRDGKMGGLFEETVVITERGPWAITKI